MSRYDLLIFDLDGTLVDTATDIASSANFVLDSLGYPKHSVEDITKGIGLGVHELMKHVVPEDVGGVNRNELIEYSVDLFRKHYVKNLVVESKLYDGVAEAFRGPLAAVKKVVVTNKPHPLALKILDSLEALDFFEGVIGTGLEYKPKPSPEAVQAMMREHKAHPGSTLLVGDSVIDWQTAQHAKIHFLGVTYGYDKALLNKKVEMVSHPNDWRRLSNGVI